MTYDAATDAVSGRFESAVAYPQPLVTIDCDGVPWATVAAVPVAELPGAFEFSCALGPVALPTRSSVVARDWNGKPVAAEIVMREPLRNALGLLASDVLATDHHPFSALPWIALSGARLTVTGMHLPPEGDPGKLSVAFGPGVAYHLAYGLASPDFRAQYWYWPNAHQSGLILTIDLAASAKGSDPFHFRFVYPAARNLGGGKRPVDVWLPRSFESFMDFPTDSALLRRVQFFSDSATAAITGYNAFETLAALFAKAGIEAASAPRLLDWGCGHGRVTCHFIDRWPAAQICGADIDAENIGWCRRHLGGSFRVLPLWPPSDFPDASFDAIFGISVMTHLTADAQEAWLAELARILRPGGVALLTFQADANAAYQSRWRDPVWWARWRECGFDDEQLDPALEGTISDSTYYRNTTQSSDDFRRKCDPYFELIAIEPAAFGGYQDCAVLRKRAL
jgi:SAM-dependent methyltransferase